MTRLTPTRARAKDDWRPTFLAALAETCNVSESANRAGVSRQAAYASREVLPEFAAAWDDAIEQATDALEAEARRRAMEGTERPIVSQGEIIATVREYSDQLTIALLKAHRPDKYRDRMTIGGDPAAPIAVKVYSGVNPETDI